MQFAFTWLIIAFSDLLLDLKPRMFKWNKVHLLSSSQNFTLFLRFPRLIFFFSTFATLGPAVVQGGRVRFPVPANDADHADQTAALAEVVASQGCGQESGVLGQTGD